MIKPGVVRRASAYLLWAGGRGLLVKEKTCAAAWNSTESQRSTSSLCASAVPWSRCAWHL